MTLNREVTETTILETGDSGSISQPVSHLDDPHLPISRSGDTGLSPLESPTIDEENSVDAFAGQINYSSGDLLQLLASFNGVPQWSDIAAHPNPLQVDAVQASHHVEEEQLDPLLFATSFTGAPAPSVQSGHGCNDAHMIPAVDENVPIGGIVSQMHTHMNPHHFSQIPDQWTSNNTQILFPTLDTFTPPVSGLPQWPAMHPNQYYPFQHIPSVQASADPNCPWLLGPLGGYLHPSVVPNINSLEMGQPNGAYPTPVTYQWHSAYSQMTMGSTMHENATMHAMTFPGAMIPHPQNSQGSQSLSGFQPFAFSPYGMVNSPSKRKAGTDNGVVGVGPSSPAGTTTPKRRRVENDTIKIGGFGAYANADATATAMPQPVINYFPVDTSRRRVVGPDGQFLRTRNYGAMEIDDSYGNRSASVCKELPAHLTCVRACEWSDQPCGLYIEVSKDRISKHLDNWHGARNHVHANVRCSFPGCEHTSAMKSLGRHIETVHYGTSWQCPYCQKSLSRSDAATRHGKTCPRFQHAIQQAAQSDHAIEMTSKLVSGYIIPARKGAQGIVQT